MKIVNFDPRPSLADALEAVDALREAILSGELIAFSAVGFSAADETFWYCGASKPVSRLRMIGAMSNALYHFNKGD